MLSEKQEVELENKILDFIDDNYKELLIKSAVAVYKNNSIPIQSDLYKDKLVYIYKTMLMAVAVLARENKIIFKKEGKS